MPVQAPTSRSRVVASPCLGGGLHQPPRARRGVRRAGALVVPDGGLPHLRSRTARRDGFLRSAAGRPARGRPTARLLRSARRRRRHRPVTVPRESALRWSNRWAPGRASCVPVPPISSDWVSLAPGRPSARAGTRLPGDCGWCRLAGRPERLRARRMSEGGSRRRRRRMRRRCWRSCPEATRAPR